MTRILLIFLLAAVTWAEVKTGEVTRGEFRVDVELAGLFVGAESAISVRPEGWKDWVITELVDHGRAVKKGDVLIRFDSKAIDHSIAEWKAHIITVEVALERAKFNIEQLRSSQAIALDEAKLKQINAEFAAKLYEESGRAFRLKSARKSVENLENYLAYEMEELKQLDKMYTNDNLIGETEEIVLKRQRDSVSRSEFSLESARRTLAYEEARGLATEDEAIVHRTERAKLDRKAADTGAPFAIREHEHAIAKAENEVAKARRTLAQYEADRAAMVVRSPQDGLVYYGRFRRGAWDRPGVEAFLFPGGKALAHKTLMTVVATDKLSVYGHVPVRFLEHVPGAKGRVVPNGLSQVSLPGTVTRVSTTPVLQDWWAADIDVELPEDRGPIVPGLTCKFR